MNLKRSLTAVPALCAVLLLAACEKDRSTAPASSSDRASLLVGKQWVLTAAVMEPGYLDENGKRVTDLLAGDPATCVDYHPVRFEAGGRIPASPAEDQGKCEDDAPPLPAGTWTLKADGAILVIDYDGETPPMEYEILSLTDRTLKITFGFPAVGDSPAQKMFQTYTAR